MTLLLDRKQFTTNLVTVLERPRSACDLTKRRPQNKEEHGPSWIYRDRHRRSGRDLYCCARDKTGQQEFKLSHPNSGMFLDVPQIPRLLPPSLSGFPAIPGSVAPIQP